MEIKSKWKKKGKTLDSMGNTLAVVVHAVNLSDNYG